MKTGGLGVFWVVSVLVVLLFTGQLLYALCGIAIALAIGYGWPALWNARLDEEADRLKSQLVTGSQQLEALLAPPKKGGSREFSVDDIKFMGNMFGCVPDKHKIRLKLQAMVADLASLEKMVKEEQTANQSGGICLGMAFLMMPGNVCLAIVGYLVLRWLLMPYQHTPVKA